MRTETKKPLITTKAISELVQMLIGNAICAFSVVCFALPYNMVVSGMSGIGRMVNYATGMSVSLVVGIFNVLLFVIGAAMLGKKFAATIALGTFAFPFFMGIFEQLTMLHHLVEEPMLAAICAGVLDGIGLGLVLRVGGSTGGIDVPAMILNRKLGWKLATVMSGIDIAIFLLQIPITASEFGTTLIRARGGYLRDEKEVILCAASNRNFNKVKRAVLSIDRNAFMTITSMNEVNGNGFTYMLDDEDYVSELEDRHDGRELSGI